MPKKINIITMNFNIAYGKLYSAGNKDKELQPRDLNGMDIWDGDLEKIYSCGRAFSLYGTSGSFDVTESGSSEKAGTVSWMVPYNKASIGDRWITFKANPDYPYYKFNLIDSNNNIVKDLSSKKINKEEFHDIPSVTFYFEEKTENINFTITKEPYYSNFLIYDGEDDISKSVTSVFSSKSTDQYKHTVITKIKPTSSFKKKLAYVSPESTLVLFFHGNNRRFRIGQNRYNALDMYQWVLNVFNAKSASDLPIKNVVLITCNSANWFPDLNEKSLSKEDENKNKEQTLAAEIAQLFRVPTFGSLGFVYQISKNGKIIVRPTAYSSAGCTTSGCSSITIKKHIGWYQVMPKIFANQAINFSKTTAQNIQNKLLGYDFQFNESNDK